MFQPKNYPTQNQTQFHDSMEFNICIREADDVAFVLLSEGSRALDEDMRRWLDYIYI